MEIKATALPGVLLLKPRRFADSRGYFVETYNQRAFAKARRRRAFRTGQSVIFSQGGNHPGPACSCRQQLKRNS